jgi:hypothetical protein
VSPSACLEMVLKRKIPSSRRVSNPDRPARSQSLYWVKSTIREASHYAVFSIPLLLPLSVFLSTTYVTFL